MKVLCTILAAAGWAWFVVVAAFLLARWYNIRLFPRLRKDTQTRGFEVLVKNHEE